MFVRSTICSMHLIAYYFVVLGLSCWISLASPAGGPSDSGQSSVSTLSSKHLARHGTGMGPPAPAPPQGGGQPFRPKLQPANRASQDASTAENIGRVQ